MMHRGFRNLALTAAGLACCLTAQPGQAATQAQEIELLKRQVEALMQQNQALSKRISEMEQRQTPAVTDTSDRTAIKEEVARQIEEQKGKGFQVPNINEHITLSGSFEGDFKAGKNFDGAHTSEFNVDTIDLFLGFQVNEWVKGLMVIEYTDDDDDIFVDEAHVTLGGTETFPFFLTGGKIYAPFGDFSTNMLQDPLTQTLGEINDSGVIVGFEQNGFKATVFAYNGIDEGDPDNDTINSYGASLSYSYEQDEMGVNAGIAWVNNLGDAEGFDDADVFTKDNPAGPDEPKLLYTCSEVDGLALNLGGKYGPFSVIFEYVTALNSFHYADKIHYGESGAKPAAFNSELAYTTQLFDKETTFAVGYQKSWEAVALELPEHRYIGAASMGILAGTTVILEYFYDENYSESDGRPSEQNGHGYGFTTRLRYEF